jgi:LAO/AO transport system kinase
MMSGHPDDEFFIRSLSSGPLQGGLAPRTAEVVAAFSGFGFDFVLVETVGAGQADVAIKDLAHEVVLVLMPGAGDAIQFSKAGIMEIASCFVINKCDLAGADVTAAQLRGSIGDDRPLLRVSTLRHEGIETVAEWADSLRNR